MGNPWEEDFFDDDYSGEESTDMGDEPPTPVALKALPENEPSRPYPARQVTVGRPNLQRQQNGKGRRTVRVRPMPPGMSAKWPDISSCLITLNSGKQVLFVKGG